MQMQKNNYASHLSVLPYKVWWKANTVANQAARRDTASFCPAVFSTDANTIQMKIASALPEGFAQTIEAKTASMCFFFSIEKS